MEEIKLKLNIPTLLNLKKEQQPDFFRNILGSSYNIRILITKTKT